MSTTAPTTHLDQGERLRRFRLMGDPLADAAVADMAAYPGGQHALLNRVLEEGIGAVPDAPESWKALFRQADHVPYWVNWKVMNQASRVFLNAGVLGMFTLCCYVTPHFYCLSTGNKALSYSGDLFKRAPRRGRETARFVIETCVPNNLQREADGFKVSLRVRLIHAHARAMILRTGKWDMEKWGMPISQHYMAAMNAQLSMGWIEGLRKLGFRLNAAEKESIIQLWRYSAYLSGIDSELQFATFEEAQRFWRLLLSQEPPPDEDARQLVAATLAAVPEVLGLQGRSHHLIHQLCRGLACSMMEKELGRQLQLPRTAWSWMGTLSRGVMPLLRLVDSLVPPVNRMFQYYGTSLWLHLAEFPPQGGLEMFTHSAAREKS